MQASTGIDPIPLLGVADPISSVTHLGGAVVFAVLGAGLLVRARGNTVRVGAVAVYITGVVFALAASGVFHGVARASALRDFLVVVDHAAIFFLIAASYTPIHVVQFKGFMRWGVLAVVWTAAITGILLKALFFDGIPEWVSLSLYLGLGWAGLVSAVALYRVVGFRPLIPLIGGALAYTLGAVLEYSRFPVLVSGILGPHEIFHLLVLVGVGLHWLYIRRIVMYARVMDQYA